MGVFCFLNCTDGTKSRNASPFILGKVDFKLSKRFQVRYFNNIEEKLAKIQEELATAGIL